METLLKEIDNILKEKNIKITLLQWEKDSLEKEVKELKAEVAGLRKENEELYYDIEKYKENEVSRV